MPPIEPVTQLFYILHEGDPCPQFFIAKDESSTIKVKILKYSTVSLSNSGLFDRASS